MIIKGIPCSISTKSHPPSFSTVSHIFRKTFFPPSIPAKEMKLSEQNAQKAQPFLQALLLHLNLLSEDYEGTIQVNLTEVYNNA